MQKMGLHINIKNKQKLDDDFRFFAFHKSKNSESLVASKNRSHVEDVMGFQKANRMKKRQKIMISYQNAHSYQTIAYLFKIQGALVPEKKRKNKYN